MFVTAAVGTKKGRLPFVDSDRDRGNHGQAH